MLAAIALAGCGGSAGPGPVPTGRTTTAPPTSATPQTTPIQEPAATTSTPSATSGQTSDTPGARDGLWQNIVRQPGISGSLGPLFGSPVRFTTVGDTTTIRLIQDTPVGTRCDGSPGHPQAPAGTVVGTFVGTAGPSFSGKVAYWDWGTCALKAFYPWTVKVVPHPVAQGTPAPGDTEPYLEGSAFNGLLDEYFHRCVNGGDLADPIGSCTDHVSAGEG